MLRKETQKERLQREIAKISTRIAADKQRLDALRQKHEEIENTEILALVHAKRLTPQQLREFLQTANPHREILTAKPSSEHSISIEREVNRNET